MLSSNFYKRLIRVLSIASAVILLTLAGAVSVFSALWMNTLEPHMATASAAVALPDDFPEINVIAHENATPGRLTFTAFAFATLDSWLTMFGSEWNYIVEIDTETGEITYVRKASYLSYNHRLHDTGQRSYYSASPLELIPSRFLIKEADIFSINSGNFYLENPDGTTAIKLDVTVGNNVDGHELILLENGNYLLFETDYNLMDLREYGCSRQCEVVWQVIRELDAEGEFVREWSLMDYYDPIEVIETVGAHILVENRNTVDITHANALYLDTDGNFIVSVRETSEVLKIDRETGDLIYRLTGDPRGGDSFTYINDPLDGFSFQHTASTVGENRMLIYDNGVYHEQRQSRVVEYELDVEAKTAELVWSYALPVPEGEDPYYGAVMGSAQRLENGNTIINFSGQPNTIVEVTPDGEVVMEIQLPPGYFSYRAHLTPNDAS